jgi:hypothetical protein
LAEAAVKPLSKRKLKNLGLIFHILLDRLGQKEKHKKLMSVLNQKKNTLFYLSNIKVEPYKGNFISADG